MTGNLQEQHFADTTRGSSTPRSRGRGVTMSNARSRAKGYPGYSEVYPRIEQAARLARELAGIACVTWRLADESAESASLMMAELFSNAVRYASGPSVRVIVDRPADDHVHLAVIDRAPTRTPELRTPGADDIGGRGLLLIDDIADRWGYDLLGPRGRPWGKRVWAQLSTD